jgi:hypothetical protein
MSSLLINGWQEAQKALVDRARRQLGHAPLHDCRATLRGVLKNRLDRQVHQAHGTWSQVVVE